MIQLVSAVMTAVALAVVLVVVPRWLLPAPPVARDGVDRVAIDVIRGAALVIAVTVVLVALGLFQWPGLLLAGVAIRAFTRRRARRAGGEADDRTEERTRGMLYLLEAACDEGNEEVKVNVRRWGATLGHRRPGRLPRATILPLVPVGGVVLASLGLRLAYPLTHVALVPTDAYAELAAVARLGMGELFFGGIQPVGLRSLLATAAELTTASNSDLIRFAGPLLATAVVAAVYALVVRTTGQTKVALLAAAAIGLSGLGRGFGPSVLHQVGTVPEALALLLAVFGVLMLVEHVRSPSWARLRYAGLAAAVVVATHPPALVPLVAAAVGTAVALTVRHRSWVSFPQIAVALGAGAAAGSLPLVVGDALTIIPDAPGASLPIAGAGPLAMIAVASILVAGVLLAGRRSLAPADRLPTAVLAGTALGWPLLVLVLSRSGPFGSLPDPGTTYLLLPVGIGALVALGRDRPRPIAGEARFDVLIGLALVGVLVAAFPPRVPDATPAQTEYDSAARVLSSALRRSADLSYTVVGPEEWTSWVVGRAYRTDLTTFADRLVLAQAADPGFQLPVPSQNVLVLTEKRAFGDDAGEIAARQALMDRVDHWVRVYQRFHPSAEVLYEDSLIRVWFLKESGSRALAERLDLAKI